MPADAANREILFEFQRVGAYVKVIAIDAATGVEVTTVGAATASEQILKRTAANKLLYVLRKQGRISS
jgi:hypothetical protein